MSYATLMTYIDVDGFPKNRVSLATGLSDKFNATLIGLCALAIRPLFLDEKFNSDRVTGADIEQMKRKVARKGDWFQRHARTEHGRVEWRPIFDFPLDALTREVRVVPIWSYSGGRSHWGTATALSILPPRFCVSAVRRWLFPTE